MTNTLELNKSAIGNRQSAIKWLNQGRRERMVSILFNRIALMSAILVSTFLIWARQELTHDTSKIFVSCCHE